MTAAPSDSRQYATFRVGGYSFGIAVLEVQEVLRGQRVTPVPLAPPVVAGLINLRGQIVPALEMRRLLGFEVRGQAEEPLSVVVTGAQGAVSLQVDEIGDVMALDAASLELPPLNVDARLRRVLLGVYELPDRLLLILDAQRTVDVTEPEWSS